ncbi:alpha/beta hydrolase [Usitatibacter palustris]|nr:alpha/beta fold hydrolase [Usitatibacter palustris]
MSLAFTRLQVSVASALAPSRAVVKAQRLFLTPPRHEHTAREREVLATGQGFTVTSTFARLAAWRFGAADRPAVVVSHGWGGRGAQFRQFVPKLVEAGYQVIAFDHAAHGYSEGDEASLVHFIRDLEAVVADLDAKGVAVAGIVGHSLGAAAIGAWLKRSGRANLRVVLIAPPSSVERYSGYFARFVGLPERLRREMQQRVEGRFGMAWRDFELPGSVEGIAAPALVIHDGGDREVAFSSGLAIARAWKDARLVRTEGLGHRAILRDPDVVRDTIDFLRDEVRFATPPGSGEKSEFSVPAPLI